MMAAASWETDSYKHYALFSVNLHTVLSALQVSYKYRELFDCLGREEKQVWKRNLREDTDSISKMQHFFSCPLIITNSVLCTLI